MHCYRVCAVGIGTTPYRGNKRDAIVEFLGTAWSLGGHPPGPVAGVTASSSLSKVIFSQRRWQIPSHRPARCAAGYRQSVAPGTGSCAAAGRVGPDRGGNRRPAAAGKGPPVGRSGLAAQPVVQPAGAGLLAWSEMIDRLVDDADLNEIDRSRARFAANILSAVTAPTNLLPGKPAAVNVHVPVRRTGLRAHRDFGRIKRL
jgi:hypothetical protein